MSNRSLMVQYTLLAILGAHTLGLFLAGELRLYIHPRFTELTVAGGLALFIFAMHGLFRLRRGSDHNEEHRHEGHEHAHPSPSLPSRAGSMVVDAVTIVAIVLAIILPAASLTATAASQRGISSALPENAAGTPRRMERYLRADFTKYNVVDLATLTSFTTGGASFSGKEVDIIGFVYVGEEEQPIPGAFYLARFFVTCCSIDGRVGALPVVQKGGEMPEKGEWLRVRGTLAQREGVTVVIPSSIEVIEEPKDPYVYQLFF